MNFLGLRSNQTAASAPASAPEIQKEVTHPLKRTATLEGLIAEDPFPDTMLAGSRNGETEGYNYENGSFEHSNGKSDSHIEGGHIDVAEGEGWIAIPYKELPTDWSEAPDISSFRSMDRSFVFPGEQVHILACFSPSKQDMEIITPFKVAAVMNKNGIGRSPNKQNASVGGDGEDVNLNSPSRTQVDSQNYITDGESLLRKEDRRRQIETLLHSFNHSHFFVRIAESDEQLWSKRRASQATLDSSEVAEKFNIGGSENMSTRKKISLSAIVDKGDTHSSITGGLARNAIKCHALSNGDIVVLLQINVGVDLLNDPVLEILQFQKHQDRGLTRQSDGRNLLNVDHDPCGELLRWLLPLDNSIPPPSRPLSPPLPQLSSSSSIRSTSIKPSSSGSSGSQMFSFGNFRSYSMSSLPQNSSPAPPVTIPSSRPNFEIDERDQFSFQKSESGQKSQNEGLLSFRGVSLEPERFSVRCGLEGIYTPGKRWRKKIEIVQPVDIHSFAADCNTDDLVCVQIKNVSPAHTPDIVVYLDAITLVYEEASSVGPPLCFPIACIEAGDEHSLPNLELRRGEEHSFILKPAASLWKATKSCNQKGSQISSLPGGSATSSWRHSSYTELKQSGSSADHYAILVSCRCNYTESRLFFKQPTSWRPRISRDLMISVASQMSRQTLGSDGRVAQLPVQVLTLQASNLTSEDLTLTVLAPASFTSPPSVLSLSSSPSSPMSPLFNASFFTNVNTASSISAGHSQTSVLDHVQRSEAFQSISLTEQDFAISDVLPSSDVGCTHLWLQSRVPLGCVPAQSTATVKLEVLPLTDGIITLDSLQIGVKEKGITYVPEHSLKINATTSVTTGVV
ncbi:OLC1v1028053C3 [Oldenlandia corymbosa var. corymbosa]|uniref:OLC1v1028053C3 n=1 Tax=Oldenlandia corymbosa var. corymbosa TaxID=529605 RepID=A0AAV1CCV4_OLDCO|nr:OLC1v1028053C3 [Oldenlandia corymbosa var. corymbosa]